MRAWWIFRIIGYPEIYIKQALECEMVGLLYVGPYWTYKEAHQVYARWRS